jgi:Domain of unknown function (DUF4388)
MYNLFTSTGIGAAGVSSMALKGNLRDFSISQLLNLVNVAQKTGTLVVERSQEQVYISFRDGKLSYAHNGTGPANLTMVLYRAKKLSAAQVRAINERAGSMSDKELGLLLINSNYMTQQDILSSLQAYYLNMVNRLFTWVDGVFHFDNELLPPKDKITVRISLENLIIEGSRRMREWEQLQGEIPSLEMALKFSQRPGISLKNLSLNADEWKVISFINPKNTIHQIARATGKNDLEIRRVVYSFLQAGLVELIRPGGVRILQPVPLPPAAQPAPTAQPVPTARPVIVGQPVQPAQAVPTARPTQLAPAALNPQPEMSTDAILSSRTVETEESLQVEQPVQPIQPLMNAPQASKTEFKSLVNRIINRIRSI